MRSRTFTVFILVVITLAAQPQDAKAQNGNAINAICGISDDGDSIASPARLIACPEMATKFEQSVLKDVSAERAGLASAACNSEQWNNLDKYRDALQQVAIDLARAKKLADWMRTSAVSIEGRDELPHKMADTSIRIFRSSADVELSFGDTALRAGCLDVADTQYRRVLTHYNQGFMTSHRQRAQVGIDDVRARRTGFLCKLANYC